MDTSNIFLLILNIKAIIIHLAVIGKIYFEGEITKPKNKLVICILAFELSTCTGLIITSLSSSVCTLAQALIVLGITQTILL